MLGKFVGGNLSQAARVDEVEPLTESELLLRARNGDMDAFSELAQRNHGPALIVARSIVDSATAEDVVADSFERLLALLARGEGPTHSLRPYFLQMVRHRAIDTHRQRREVPFAGFEEPAVVDADTADASDASDHVQQAFASLPERWQAALWLSAVDGMSHADIGRELDLSENAVNQLVHRSKEGLRQAYLTEVVGSARQECQPVSELLSKYVRGRCGSRAEQRVAAHLETCDVCQAAVADLRRLNSRIGSALAVGVLGGVGLALARQPARAMAAEGFGGAVAGGILRVSAGVAIAGLVVSASAVLTPLVGGESNTSVLAQRALSTPAVVPSSSATPSPTPTGKSLAPSTSPKQGTPLPKPSSADPSAPDSIKPAGVNVVVGQATAEWIELPGEDVRVTVPVKAPSNVSLIARVQVEGWLSTFSVQSVTGFGNWSCAMEESSEARAVLSCTMAPSTRHDLTMYFRGAESGAVCVTVEPVEFPELDPSDNATQVGFPQLTPQPDTTPTSLG